MLFSDKNQKYQPNSKFTSGSLYIKLQPSISSPTPEKSLDNDFLYYYYLYSSIACALSFLGAFPYCC